MVRVGRALNSNFEQLEQAIRERAYQIFHTRDVDDGDALSDWFQAQSELLNDVDLEWKEQKRSYVVEGRLDGYTSKDIDVEINGRVLTISGVHCESSDEDSDSSEHGYTTKRQQFIQQMTLPEDVDLDKVHAKLHKNGKFKLSLPKHKHG